MTGRGSDPVRPADIVSGLRARLTTSLGGLSRASTDPDTGRAAAELAAEAERAATWPAGTAAGAVRAMAAIVDAAAPAVEHCATVVPAALERHRVAASDQLLARRHTMARLGAIPSAVTWPDAVAQEAVRLLDAAGGTGERALAALAGCPMPERAAGSNPDRQEMRFYRSEEAAEQDILSFCDDAIAAAAAALESAAHRIDTRLVDGLRDLVSAPSPPPLPGVRPAWPAPPARPLRTATFEVAGSLRAAARETASGDLPSIRVRLKVANRFADDLLGAAAGRGWMVIRSDVAAALLAAWSRLLTTIRQATADRFAALAQGEVGAYLRGRDECRAAWQATAADSAAGLERTLTALTARRDSVLGCAAEFRAVAGDVGRLADGEPGEVPPVLLWCLQDAPPDPAGDRPAGTLRIAVVAPMKSGKSTLLNAIVGIEILPTRQMAMTCLPTELELADPRTTGEVRLELEPTFTDRLRNLPARLRRAGEPRGDAVRLIARHAHLAGLLAGLRDGQGIAVPGTVTGAGPVRSALTLVNDLIRLAVLLVPAELDDLLGAPPPPRVTIPYASGHGRLILVDTPGPDETGAAGRLAAVVERELSRADAAVLVMDYTRLDGTTGATLSARLATAPHLLADGGAIVVNRTDQRRSGDRDPEAVRRFVRHQVDRDDGPIVETSAYHSLVATAFLADPDNEAAAKELIGVCFPDGPDEDPMPRERLHRLAQRLENRSGLPALREQVIGPAVADAPRLAARAAAGRILRHLTARPARRYAELADDLGWCLRRIEPNSINVEKGTG